MFSQRLNYWHERVSCQLPVTELITLLSGTFCVLLLSVVVLHAFIPAPQPVMLVLLHGLSVSFTYTSIVALVLGSSVAVIKNHGGFLAVWQIWMISLSVYCLGFILSSIANSQLKFELHEDLSQGTVHFHFFRLLPVWALVTHLLVGFLQKRGLKKELESLAKINDALQSPPAHLPRNQVVLPSGEQKLSFDVDAITHISVDDHYCYVYKTDGTKSELGSPLSQIESLLELPFVRIHRSHIVNLDHIERIEKVGRNYHLAIAHQSGQTKIPISRSRVETVIPLLEARSSGDCLPNQ